MRESEARVPTSRMAVWIAAIRPKTLTAAVSPVLVGTAMAWDAGGFHALAAVCAFVCALLVQIGTNLCNDYADFLKGADTSQRKGPLRVVQAGLLSAATVRRAAGLVFSCACICGLYLIVRGGIPALVIAVASVLSGILYTTTKWSLAYLGLGDLFVIIFFGPVAVGGTYYVQTLSISGIVLTAGLATGLLACAILVVNNVRDIDEDRQAGKKTLVVRLGKRFGIGFWAACIAIAAVIPLELLVVTGEHRWAAASILIVIPALYVLDSLRVETEPTALNPLVGYTAMLLLAHSVLFSVGWIL